MRTHYQVLGVPADASSAAIREAYRHRAREHHPDRARSSAVGPSGAMPDVNEAYRVLSDPGRRAMYDASLRRAEAPPTTESEPEVDESDEPWPVAYPDGPARVPLEVELSYSAGTAAAAAAAGWFFYDYASQGGFESFVGLLLCVLVITGKGRGVLREEVPRWLNEPGLRDAVLSFAYARPADGGEGALYVLLKRRRPDKAARPGSGRP